MKQVFIATLLTLAIQPAFAAKYQSLKKLTNVNLQNVWNSSADTDKLLSTKVKVIAMSDAKGRTPLAVRTAMVAQVAHSLCRFFDDGVNIGKDQSTAAGIKSGFDILDQDGWMSDDGNSEMRDAMIDGLTKAAVSGKVEVYSGDASGNNTMGTVLGAYDLQNNEIIVFSYTNCGSDD